MGDAGGDGEVCVGEVVEALDSVGGWGCGVCDGGVAGVAGGVGRGLSGGAAGVVGGWGGGAGFDGGEDAGGADVVDGVVGVEADVGCCGLAVDEGNGEGEGEEGGELHVSLRTVNGLIFGTVQKGIYFTRRDARKFREYRREKL